MATDFQIGYFDYTIYDVIAQTTAESGYDHEFLLGGAKYKHFRASAAGTSSNVDFQASSVQQPDFLAVARADLPILADSADITISLIGDSSSGFATTPETESATIGKGDLKGVTAEDYIFNTTFGTAWEYYRFKLETTDSIVHEYSKVFFGNWFDLGQDPVYDESISVLEKPEHGRRNYLKIELKWEGVTDAVKQSFNTKIIERSDAMPLFLHDPNDYVLLGYKTLFVLLDSASWRTTNVNQNTLTATFSELL